MIYLMYNMAHTGGIRERILFEFLEKRGRCQMVIPWCSDGRWAVAVARWARWARWLDGWAWAWVRVRAEVDPAGSCRDLHVGRWTTGRRLKWDRQDKTRHRDKVG